MWKTASEGKVCEKLAVWITFMGCDRSRDFIYIFIEHEWLTESMMKRLNNSVHDRVFTWVCIQNNLQHRISCAQVRK